MRASSTCATILLLAAIARADDGLPKPVRIASDVSGHIHPAACVTRNGTVLVIFGKRDYKDLMLTRSTDGGLTWAKPELFPGTEKLDIYPGSLTTLDNGRVVHAWNTWYMNEKNKKSRFVQWSMSEDGGKTWGPPHSLPKNPDAESVIRHPFLDLPERDWLAPLMDKTVRYNPKTGEVAAYGDGQKHGLVPIVFTSKGTLVSGSGQRSTDGGKTWTKVSPFPKIGENGWRFDLVALENGWLVASEVEGPGVGGDKWRYVVSRDDGVSWDFDGAVEFYNPGRPIGGRACPRTVQLDKQTIGTVFYDVDAKQPGGSGVFFLRVPVAKLAPAKK